MRPNPDIAPLALPPQFIEGEQSLIGGLLLSNAAWDRIGDMVCEADFYRDDHRRIFRHIIKLIGSNHPADVVTVSESLEKSGEIEQAGGLAYLGEIASNTPSAANIVRYAEIVRERAILRRLVAVSDEISCSAMHPKGRDAGDILDEAEGKILAISEARTSKQGGLQPITASLGPVVDAIQALYDRDSVDSITGVPTGYVDFDRMTLGLQPGDMVIIAGRPSMGKTSFALNIAQHVGVELRLPVAVFSLEMPTSQLTMRMISSVGRIDFQQLRTGRLTDENWQRLAFALGKLNEAPIHIDETGAINPTELRARARRWAREHNGKIGLIVIDYLQLMTVADAGGGEHRAQEISRISGAIKALAKELAVPIIALSQLNRGLEQRPNKRPVMSDLRESGALEQDADLIVFLYRDEVYNPDSQDKGTAEIIIGKQRNGPIGQVQLAFQGEYTRFDNLARSL